MMRLKEQGCGRSLAVRGGVRGGRGGCQEARKAPSEAATNNS